MAKIFKPKKKEEPKKEEEEKLNSVMGNDSLIRFRSKPITSKNKK